MEFHTWRRRIDTAVMWKHGLQLLYQKLLVPDQSKKCKPRFEKLDSIWNVLRARLERKYNCWIKWLNKQKHLCSVCPQCYIFALGLGTPESWVSSLSSLVWRMVWSVLLYVVCNDKYFILRKLGKLSELSLLTGSILRESNFFRTIFFQILRVKCVQLYWFSSQTRWMAYFSLYIVI